MNETARRATLAALVGALAAAAVVFAATRPASGAGAAPAATDRWLPLASSPLVRSEVAAARIGRGVYVVGGYDRGVTSSAVAAYDIKSDSWARPASMPVAVNHPTAVAYRGRVYVHGGFIVDGQGTATSALQRYDPDTDTWKLMQPSAEPRAAHALVRIGGKLYAAGGANGSTGRMTTLEIYNVARDRWKRGPEMEVGRNHVAAAVLQGRMYVLGGRPGNLDVVEAYDSERRKWSRAAPLDAARSGFTAVVVKGRIVAFGGEEAAGTIAPVELYRPGRDRWSPLPEMLTPRHGLGGAAKGRRVFALEGGSKPGGHYSNVAEYLDVPRSLTR